MAKKTFKIGITMAGAISAGAYTAGVMDYLLETIDKWYKAKGSDPSIPAHDIEIQILSGASAGGMTAAITAAAIKNKIPHITVDKRTDEDYKKGNILYNSWVNLTGENMMQQMLQNDDIDSKGAISLLNSDFIDEVAGRSLQIDKENIISRDYFAEQPQIFMTLSSINGIPYKIRFESYDGSQDFLTIKHSDIAHFRLNEKEYKNDGRIPLSFEDDVNVELLGEAAKATGAFPVGLASRKVLREKKWMQQNPWINPAAGTVFEEIDIQDPFDALTIDGGMIENEPFTLTRQMLLEQLQESEAENSDADKFNGTVLMIDPFPSGEYKPPEDDSRLLAKIIPRIFSTMRKQLLFHPDDIKTAYNEKDYSRFLIAPKRVEKMGEAAIACGSLGGFGGFFDIEFRRHDFFLGRRNCQLFLRRYFAVPTDTQNPIFKEGYSSPEARERFLIERGDNKFLPLIPDPGYVRGDLSANAEPLYDWPKYDQKRFNDLQKPMKKRLKKLLTHIAEMGWLMKTLLKVALFFASGKIVKKITGSIKEDFGKRGML